MSRLNEGSLCLVRTESQDSERLFQQVYAAELKFALGKSPSFSFSGTQVEVPSQCQGAAASTSDEQSSSLSLLTTSRLGELQASTGIGTLAVDQTTQIQQETPTAEHPNTEHDRHPHDRADRPRGTKKMDYDSPTQANVERDYDDECHPATVDSTPRITADTTGCLTSSDTQRKSDDLQNHNDDDTGAVVFETLTQDSEIFSPLTHENPSMHRGNWRDGISSSQQNTPRADSQNFEPPETPALQSANPFLQKQASVLRATQMFNATQPSSALKKFSPTSSRPSPPGFNMTFPPDTSPALPYTSPLMDRRALSSPSRLRDHSPIINDLAHQTSQASGDDEAIPESPTDGEPARNPESSPPRKRLRQEPLAVYEPMAVSQERKRNMLKEIVDSDKDEHDRQMERRRQANRRRESAKRGLEKIVVTVPDRQRRTRTSKSTTENPDSTCPSKEKALSLSHNRTSIATRRGTGRAALTALSAIHEVPHTSRRGSVELFSKDDPEEGVAMAETALSTIHQGTRTHRGSVELGSNDNFDGNIDMTDEPAPEELLCSKTSSPDKAEGPITQSSNMLLPHVPQSSPPRLRDRPASKGASGGDDSETCEPESLVVPESDLAQETATIDVDNGDAAPIDGIECTPAQLNPSTLDDTPTRTSRGQLSVTTPQEEAVASDSELLTDLSSTPDLPSLSPVTANPISPMDMYNIPTSSANEPQVPKSARMPLLRAATSVRSLRTTRRSSRRRSPQSDSADELTKTPSQLGGGPTSFSASRTSIPPRSVRPSELRGNLFDNMAFAISFRAREDGETNGDFEERCSIIKQLAGMVSRAGGRILATGFNELLEPGTLAVPSVRNNNAATHDEQSPVELRPDTKTLGFTALLADGHSRKVKYMQALALGLPCLAYQWATACIDKNEILDWTPYLLCAGESACFGGASLSRWLTPYNAHDALLSDVIAQRKALLGNKRVLLVMKRQRGEGSKMSYILLARILGANLVRVQTARDARAALRESVFDWAYVDEQTASEEDVFGEEEPEGPSRSRKRKRGSTGSGASASAKSKKKAKDKGEEKEGPSESLGAVPKVRCLSNELLIQSLIMGRVIDEEEKAANGLA